MNTSTLWAPISFSLPEGEVAGYRTGRPGAPPLLFCHANGFCASAYRQLLVRLAGVYDVFAMDLRGHGATSLHADPAALTDWSLYGRDVSAVIAAAETRFSIRAPWTLAGHSLGAIAGVLASDGTRPVRRLALIEPVLPAPLFRALSRSPLWPLLAPRIPIFKAALNRRAHWPARADVIARYESKTLFKRFAPGVLDDYLTDGLTPDPDGDGVALACTPGWEAATFMAPQLPVIDLLRAARARAIDISVLAAGDGSARQSTVSLHARAKLSAMGADVQTVPGAGHLIALEDLDRCAAFLLADNAQPSA